MQPEEPVGILRTMNPGDDVYFSIDLDMYDDGADLVGDVYVFENKEKVAEFYENMAQDINNGCNEMYDDISTFIKDNPLYKATIQEVKIVEIKKEQFVIGDD